MHQFKREKDEYSRIAAEMSDYAIAYQLMKDAFLEGLGQKNQYTDKRLELISKEGKMTAKRISEMTGVSVAAISQWLNPLVSKGVLIWCDENGVKFQDVEALEKSKRSGNAYIRINGTFGLPTPFDLTGDERWASDGELYREYDLELDHAVDLGGWSDDLVEVAPGIESDSDKIIDFSKMHQSLGVKVLSENNGLENKDVGNNGAGSPNNSDYAADRLTDEFSGILSFN